MLKESDTNIEEISAEILSVGYDVAFIVPTITAMKKSIIDAHDSLRSFLRRNEIHDYFKQKQGAKKQIEAKFITSTETNNVTISFYRPETGDGDPRIWIYGLNKFASPYNLIAIIYFEHNLYVVNCSKYKDLEYALNHAIPKPIIAMSKTANILLEKLRIISAKGFIPSIRQGDTGVGMTLEDQLGIPPNSKKTPDFHGIELKATRVTKGKIQKNKNQLFSKIPKWKLSPIGTAKNLVLSRGYIDTDGQLALRHTISGAKPNSRGLYLDIDYANDYLRQMFTDIKSSYISPEHDITWVLKDLREALKKKHNETFWVKAYSNGNRLAEEFHYVEAHHTTTPYINKLEALFETGLVTIEYTLHLKPSGKARDHGYLFKIKSKSMNALFPKPFIYDLTA